MNEIKLLPCPFCGGEAKFKKGFPWQQQKGVRQAFIQCKECGCRTPVFKQNAYQKWEAVDHQAVETWNARKPMQRIVKRLEDEPELVVREPYLHGRYIKKNRAIDIVKEEGGLE